MPPSILEKSGIAARVLAPRWRQLKWRPHEKLWFATPSRPLSPKKTVNTDVWLEYGSAPQIDLFPCKRRKIGRSVGNVVFSDAIPKPRVQNHRKKILYIKSRRRRLQKTSCLNTLWTSGQTHSKTIVHQKAVDKTSYSKNGGSLVWAWTKMELCEKQQGNANFQLNGSLPDQFGLKKATIPWTARKLLLANGTLGYLCLAVRQRSTMIYCLQPGN
jgi:hypothetical protein